MDRQKLFLVVALIAIAMIFAIALVLHNLPRHDALVSIEMAVLRSQSGFFCLKDMLIYAPNGLEVYGRPPEALRECSPSPQPIAGSERGVNFLLRPVEMKGWTWRPQSP